jgi:hypothetical protein
MACQAAARVCDDTVKFVAPERHMERLRACMSTVVRCGGAHPCRLRCAACPDVVFNTFPGTMDRKGNFFVPDSKRFDDQLPNSADQSGKWCAH